MTERAERAELVVGAAVLAIAAGFLAWSVGGWGERGQGTYPLVASFPNVDGVERGTEVRLAGVRVGRVSDVRLNPDTYYAEAELRVPESIVLPTDTVYGIGADAFDAAAVQRLLDAKQRGRDQVVTACDTPPGNGEAANA